ncbi:MAG: biopolymer transporter ExbD [Planctomycetes bacterium]|nr:biopolymer transporter ExbD [Planctomycetota bacterium]
MLIRAKEQTSILAIELTPLIDVVFLLLIFFLVATTLHQEEREMQIALPFASSSAPISTMLRELIINVDADGQIILAGQPISEDRLRDTVNEAVAANPEQKVTVRGDRGTAYANVVQVLDICKGAGIQEPYLDTVLPGS